MRNIIQGDERALVGQCPYIVAGVKTTPAVNQSSAINRFTKLKTQLKT